ncbi:MAG: ABC transporter ATP-binding protein [Chloroflexi bacterium]|nr:ABC transporter ATP-binding protein [Chloroflexota bacterium]
MADLVRDYLWRYRRDVGLGLLATIAATLLGLLTPYLLRRAIDAFAARSGAEAAAGELAMLAGAIMVVALVEAVARFFARLLVTSASRRVEYDLRNRYVEHLERFEPAFFQRHRTGDLMARATNDLGAVRQLFGPALYHVMNTVVLFAIALTLMFQVSPALAWWATGVLPIAAIVFAVTRARIEQRFTRVQEQFAAMSDHAQEVFAGQRVVKAYAQEARELETFRRTSQEYVNRQLAQIRVTGLLGPSMSLVIGLLVVALLYVGGREVVDGRLSLGGFVQFNAYLAMLAFPTTALGWVATLWQQGRASLVRLHEILAEEPAITSVVPATGERYRGEIELRNVTLTIGTATLLRDVSLHIRPGETVALVGPLGSGKSLLAALIARLYDPTEGQVLVDGRDVRRHSLQSLRQNIGYVPQETFLFSGTVSDNVAFGIESNARSAERIRGAVRLSQLEKDLDQWPAGLETVVGERGVTLSGGQKQRTAIARALAKDPPILVLDDALSSVDTRTEEAILHGLQHFVASRTTLVIAHRLSSTRLAERVYVLHDGRIVEQGSHAALVQRNGFYTRMYRRQLIAQELDVAEETLDDEQPETAAGPSAGRAGMR